MTTTGFQKATKHSAKLRLALAGPAGSGKTYTALSVACALAEKYGGRVAVVDTEHGSASKYADLFDFDALELESFHPQRYIEAIDAATEAGYGVLVIDSLSHAWMGKDGALELVDRAAKRSQTGNSFGAWRDVTPLHNALVEAMIGSDLHLIVTLRSKQDYVQEKDEKGRTSIRKVGMAPVQRDGLEYEFDVYGDLDQDNNLMVGKTRCPSLAGQVIVKPGKQLATTLDKWLQGAPAPAREQAPAKVVDLPTREREVDDVYRCAECKTPIVAQTGEPINASQADVLIQRDGRLTCREHRGLKAVAS
jgi:energy-coupling factor transporter ATP-binding protein EcfA2